jgi:hypothetical protein
MATVLAELSDKKIEGFKLHITHNVRPFVNRIRFAPEVASRPERIAKDLANVKVLATILEEEAAMLRKWRPPPPAVDKTNAAPEGADVAMAAPESVDGEDEPEPDEKGSDAVERHIERVMNDLREQGLVDPNDEKAYEAKKTVISLDLYIAYLRAAYHTCYYCSVVTDHVEELQRKCIQHRRKPLSKMLLEEVKLAEAEKAEKEKNANGDDKDKEPSATKEVKEKNDNRDWKRNGALSMLSVRLAR